MVETLTRIYYGLTLVYDGGEIPPGFAAIKDGNLYECGRDIGRVLSVQLTVGGMAIVTYLQGGH